MDKHHSVNNVSDTMKAGIGNTSKKSTSKHSYKRSRSEYLAIVEQWRRWEGSCPLPRSASIEHVLPHSIVPVLESDMRNMLVYNGRVNSIRGNAPMSGRLSLGANTKAICPHSGADGNVRQSSDLESLCFVHGRGHSRRFVPSPIHRGRIARIAAHFILEDPRMLKAINAVLDAETMIIWHHMYPITPFERYLNDMIFAAQGSRNLLVDTPGVIHDIASIAGVDARVFSGFGWKPVHAPNIYS